MGPADTVAADEAPLSDVAAAELLDLGVDVFVGHGRFIAGDAVEVGDQRVHFRRALIATGGRPIVPPVPGLEEVGYRTPAELLELDRPPARLAILGTGGRACELAQAMARLGHEVHLVGSGQRLLPDCDAEAARQVDAALRYEKIGLHLATEIRAVQPGTAGGGVLEIEASTPSGDGTGDTLTLQVDDIVLAAGQRPNVERLGLEAAGIDYDLSGIEVGRRLRTSNRRIFAAGGVIAGSGLEHIDSGGRLAVRNALLFRRLVHRRPVAVRAVLTTPEVAWVGLEAAEATRRPAVDTLTVPVTQPVARPAEPAADAARPASLLRLHLGRYSGRILGGTLVAPRASELIAPLALAVHRKMRLRHFAAGLVPYPADGNVYRRAAAAWQERRVSPAKALLRFFVRLSSWPPRRPFAPDDPDG